MSIRIRTSMEKSLEDFLIFNGYSVELLTSSVLKAVKDTELPVFINFDEKQLFFEVDLGNIEAYASKELYFNLLDLNTEILPVSLGFNNTKKNDPRLVLVESREVKNLDDNEVMEVLTALELAAYKVESLLESVVK